MGKLSTLAILTTLSAASAAFAEVNAPKVVYGIDNRIETYESDLYTQKLAASTAGMVSRSSSVELEDFTFLAPYTLEQRFGTCEGEKFADQATPVNCSGFLVAPDLLVTAGHCINTQKDCDGVSWVFDYKVDEKTGEASVLIPNKNVYKCKEVVEAKLESTLASKVDYALVRLERVVEGREPLKTRVWGKVALGTDITVIGHPSGLPQKVAGGATVVENSDPNYFKTNLDTFGGNSGSAVFDDNTGMVEGILVRGAKDYEKTEEGCLRVHETTQEVTDFRRYGESVSRITDIKTLKYRSILLDLAKNGNLDLFKSFARLVPEANVYDNEMNTALHVAAANNQVEIVDYLIEKKTDLNVQNEYGESALQMASFNKSEEAMRKLLEAGASAL